MAASKNNFVSFFTVWGLNHVKNYCPISDLCRFQKFQEEAEMWREVQALTTSLRSDTEEPDAVFLRDMFSHVPLGE
jgi:hypothetical protein